VDGRRDEGVRGCETTEGISGDVLRGRAGKIALELSENRKLILVDGVGRREKAGGAT